MHKLLLAGLAAIGLMAAPSANAAVAYNIGLTGPGVYYGTGNGGSTNWTVDTGSLELGLDVVTRFVGPVTPTTTNVYDVGLGDTTVSGKQGSLWGFAFSARALTGLLKDYTFSMSITDVLHGNNVTFDPMTIPDNAGTDGTNVAGGGSGCLTNSTAACLVGTRTGFQNAETLSFTTGNPSVFDPMYVSGENNTWLISLTANDLNGLVVGSVDMTVNAGTGAPVPEPASMALLGVGLLGTAAFRRKLT